MKNLTVIAMTSDEMKAFGAEYLKNVSCVKLNGFTKDGVTVKALLQTLYIDNVALTIGAKVEKAEANLKAAEADLSALEKRLSLQLELSKEDVDTLKKARAKVSRTTERRNNMIEKAEAVSKFVADNAKAIEDANNVFDNLQDGDKNVVRILFAALGGGLSDTSALTKIKEAADIYKAAEAKCTIKDGALVLTQETKEAYLALKKAIEVFAAEFSIKEGGELFNKKMINFNKAETLKVVRLITADSLKFISKEKDANCGRFIIEPIGAKKVTKLFYGLTVLKYQGGKLSELKED